MTTREAFITLRSQLENIYDNREASNISKLVLEHITGFTQMQILLQKNYQLNAEQLTNYFSYTTKLLMKMPVQYVLHEAWFAGMKLYVDENVLIPRPETEELVEWISKEASNSSVPEALNILDIGTGSGCIAISLKKYLPKTELYALDISPKALDVAAINAHTLKKSVHFLQYNILQSDTEIDIPEIDIMVSNPPYVRLSERKDMERHVIDYEPEFALFVPDEDPLLFYKSIILFAKKHLKPEGLLFFEINESLQKELHTLLASHGYINIEFKCDMQGKYRMAKAIKNL